MSETTMRRGAGMIVFAVIASVALLPLTAAAATFSVTLDKQIIKGQPGERYALGTFDVPTDLVGQICSVTATGNNNTSVHVGNNIEVTSANTVTLIGVEDAPNKTTVANGNLTLSEQLSFTLVLGNDPVYSAEFDVVLDCQPAATTTSTTTTSSTTTTAPTTTTVPDSTTSSTTTTIAPETTSTSIANTTTTTVEPEVEQETTSTTAAPATEDTLPFTGVSSGDLARIAYIGLAAGAGLVFLTRRSEERG